MGTSSDSAAENPISGTTQPPELDSGAVKLQSLRARKKADTKDALARAAAELMLETGSEGASIRAITRRAKVSSRTFHNYFPNRDAAFLHFVDAYVTDIVSWVEQAEPGLSIVELLRRLTHEIMISGEAPLPSINLAASLGEHISIQLGAESGKVLPPIILRLSEALHQYCGKCLSLLEIHLLVDSVTGMISAATEIERTPGYVTDDSLVEILDVGFDRLARGFEA